MDGSSMACGAAAPDLPAANDGRDAVGSDHTANNATDLLGPARDFTKIIAIKVKEKTFFVHKDVLTTQPEMFEAACKARSLDGKVQPFPIEGVSPNLFAEYIQFLQQSIYVPRYKLLLYYPARTAEDLYPLCKLVAFWGLADIFFNINFQKVIVESIKSHLDTMSVEGWRSFWLDQCDTMVGNLFMDLQKAYKLCKKQLLPFKESIISACANCPPQAFAELITILEPEFRTEVARRLALRHADPEFTKKRKATQDQLSKGSGKRQKEKDEDNTT